MLFNSIDFAIFLPVVFLLYWFVANRNVRIQNLLVVAASFLFYGWWDWRFLSLLVFSSLVDYLVGLQLYNSESKAKRKALLWVSICINLGLLGFFKYFNFFVDNFVTAFTFLGLPMSARSLDIVLPIGISFYTFQTLSYSIDIYRRKLEPTKDVVAFLAFVSFFPQLVAGPIERATSLLPQFFRKREFNHIAAVDGTRQILWGMFKKIVVADNLAVYSDLIFNNYSTYSGSTLMMGAFLFSFQKYCDFSGYSDIAIGTARLFGFSLMRNFAFPLFSRDIAEFWRRWHISLSSWFRDYVYIPLGGSRGNTLMKVRNTFIIFLISSFWHGANWTFIIWGMLNAIYFLPTLLLRRNRVNLDTVAQGKLLPSLVDVWNMAATWSIATFAWIFFRSENVGHAFGFIKRIFSTRLFSFTEILEMKGAVTGVFFCAVFIVVEWLGRGNQYAIEDMGTRWSKPARWFFYYSVVLCILYFAGRQRQFVYFQF